MTEAIQDRLNRLIYPIDEWALREARYTDDDLALRETLFSVGNGYLGMRGNMTEGRESAIHGTFINGFHETWRIRHAEEAYGFATVGQGIVNVPDAKLIRIYIDDEPLLLASADLESYERSLDFRSGTLDRELLWRTPAGRHATIKTTRMVSFTQRHLAMITYEVTMDADAPIVISSQILNRQDGEDEYHVRSAAMGEGQDPRKASSFEGRVLEPDLQWQDRARYVLGYHCTHSGMTLAVGDDHLLETDCEVEEHSQIDRDVAKHIYRIRAKAGKTIRLTKFVSYHTSRGVPPRELADRVRRTLDRAMEDGPETLHREQREWLADFWDRSDVKVHDPATQQAVRWNLFQLAQATARAEGAGIPAKGLTGAGYSGHYFWDSEIYVMPFLSYTSPIAARNAIRFRYSLLDAARRRAGEMNQAGALYPWRTINGEESSAYYAAGTAQYHIDADVAYALVQYVNVTGDEEFLEHMGAEMLVETARMWASLGFWRGGEDPEFHIYGVTGPDEYTTVVNDNLFTNVMARFNMRAAAGAFDRIGKRTPGGRAELMERLHVTDEEIASWQRAADFIHVPFNTEVGVHPQDEQFLDKEVWDVAGTPQDRRPLLLHYHPLVIYRFQVLKQTDVVLALFLQGEEFTAEDKLNDFDYYDPLTTGDSSLSAVTQSIIAAEVGYQELAQKYFSDALYVDLADRQGNSADGVHIASVGGVWSALVFGFAGMRDSTGTITFDPRLPETWKGIDFNLTIRGSRIRVALTQEEIVFTHVSGDPVKVWVRGVPVQVQPSGSSRVSLVDQGPRLIGAPSSGDYGRLKRSDGTTLNVSLPQHGNEEAPEQELMG